MTLFQTACNVRVNITTYSMTHSTNLRHNI